MIQFYLYLRPLDDHCQVSFSCFFRLVFLVLGCFLPSVKTTFILGLRRMYLRGPIRKKSVLRMPFDSKVLPRSTTGSQQEYLYHYQLATTEQLPGTLEQQKLLSTLRLSQQLTTRQSKQSSYVVLLRQIHWPANCMYGGIRNLRLRFSWMRETK